jgi:hypothetical protein
MKLAVLTATLFFHGICDGQNILYKQTNKIQEYNYGVVDTAGMRQLSEIEKIKYELKFVEKTYSKTIFDDFNSVYEVKIDSNEYQQDWMKLARRFKYSNSGMEMYDGNNVWMKTLPYSTEQIANREEAKADIQEFGYHPGLAIFPEFTTDLIAQLATQNVQVTNLANGEVKVVSDGVTTLFNKYKLTIVTEFNDKEGYKNRQTQGYDPYLTNKGYLLRINKSERFVHSVNGPCITDTKITYYSNYTIQDPGALIDKAMIKPESLSLYPNPNDGVFTVAADLNNNVTISSVKVISVQSGAAINIDHGNQKTFLVNLPNLATGNYVLQVVTSQQKSLTVNFFKN